MASKTDLSVCVLVHGNISVGSRRRAQGMSRTSTESICSMRADHPHHHGHRQRLRDRFMKHGLAGFADYEVLELLLTLAIPRSDVKRPAKALMTRFGNLRGILDAPLEELQAVEGIGAVAPVALRIIREAASLYLQQAAEQYDSFADPSALARFWRLRI